MERMQAIVDYVNSRLTLPFTVRENLTVVVSASTIARYLLNQIGEA